MSQYLKPVWWIIPGTLLIAVLTSLWLQHAPGSAQERPYHLAVRNGRRVIPNVPLTTQDGKQVRLYEDLIKDRTVVVSFIYTQCQGTCPATVHNLKEMQSIFADRLGKDVLFLSITLDPDVDSPAVLKKYAEGLGAQPGWEFLTGKFEDIEQVRYAMGVYDLDPVIDADRTQHGAILTFGNDKAGKWAALPALLPPGQTAGAILVLTNDFQSHNG